MYMQYIPYVTTSVVKRLVCLSRMQWIVGSSPGQVKQKATNLVFVASPLSTQHWGERAKNGWLRIRIMYPSGVTCLSADCCFSELTL